MLGAWLFADNSSRAPGAPWGGAMGMPSLRIVRHGDEGACVALRGAAGRAGRAAGRRSAGRHAAAAPTASLPPGSAAGRAAKP